MRDLLGVHAPFKFASGRLDTKGLDLLRGLKPFSCSIVAMVLPCVRVWQQIELDLSVLSTNHLLAPSLVNIAIAKLPEKLLV